MAWFRLTGTGHAHDDIFVLLDVVLVGGAVGLVTGPALVWRRWRRQSPF